MAVYRIQLADGRVARIEADTSDAAMAHAATIPLAAKAAPAPAPPAPSGGSNQADYLRELAKQRAVNATQRASVDNTNTLSGQITGKRDALGSNLESTLLGATAPVLGEITGGVGALGNAAVNIKRRITGEPTVSSRSIYEADRDAVDEYSKEVAARKPLTTLAGQVGGFAAGGELAGAAALKGGALLEGLPGVKTAAALARNSALGTRTTDAINGVKGLVQSNVGPRVVNAVTGLGKAVGQGVLGGAALGGLEGRSADERMSNAVDQGLSAGAISGVLHGVGVPVAKYVGNLGTDAIRGVRDMLGPKGALDDLSPPDLLDLAQKAQESLSSTSLGTRIKNAVTGGPSNVAQQARAGAIAAAALAKKTGTGTAAQIAAKAAETPGETPMFGELMGAEGERQLAATARREGATGQDVRTLVQGRASGMANRIMQSVKDKFGVDPEHAKGDVEAMIQAGEAKAGPLWAAVRENPQGIWTPKLAELWQRPSVQSAIKEAQADLKESATPSSGLTLGRVEIPSSDEAPMFGDAGTEMGAKGRNIGAETGGLPLLRFIGKNGGLKNVDGELAAMGGDLWHVGKPYHNRLIGPNPDKAVGLEHMADMAFDAGYFPERVGMGPPSGREFLDTIRDEVSRDSRFARGGEAVSRSAGSRAGMTAEQRYHGDTLADDLPHPDQYGAAPGPPDTEPAFMEAPTAGAWDLVRRSLGKGIDWRPSTPLARREADRVRGTHAELSAELAGAMGGPGGAIPGLREALDSSDYLKVRSAFNDISKSLTLPKDEFKAAWDRLGSEGEKFAGKASLVTDIAHQYGRAALKGSKFATPDIEANLKHAFKDQPIDDFLKEMQAKSRLAASGARAAPFSGSPTMGLTEAAKEQDQNFTSDVQRVMGRFARKDYVGGLVDAVGSGAAGLLRSGRTAGSSVTQRDVYGHVLQMAPEDAKKFMDFWGSLPEAAQRDMSHQLGALGAVIQERAHQVRENAREQVKP